MVFENEPFAMSGYLFLLLKCIFDLDGKIACYSSHMEERQLQIFSQTHYKKCDQQRPAISAPAPDNLSSQRWWTQCAVLLKLCV